jgi:hypothetical protein
MCFLPNTYLRSAHQTCASARSRKALKGLLARLPPLALAIYPAWPPMP